MNAYDFKDDDTLATVKRAKFSLLRVKKSLLVTFQNLSISC